MNTEFDKIIASVMLQEKNPPTVGSLLLQSLP